MNRTQKEAWLGLVGSLLMAGTYSFATIQLFVIRKPPGLIHCLVPLLVFFLFMISCYVVCRKKRNSDEVNEDERDRLILKRAAIATFAAFVMLLVSAYTVLWFAVGLNGVIPVWSVPVFLVIVAMPAMIFVYSLAVLVQYGRGGQDGKE